MVQGAAFYVQLDGMTNKNAVLQHGRCGATAMTIVIRDAEGSSVGPTLRVSMLNPRPLNMPAMRVSTPNLFSTRIEMV